MKLRLSQQGLVREKGGGHGGVVSQITWRGKGGGAGRRGAKAMAVGQREV